VKTEYVVAYKQNAVQERKTLSIYLSLTVSELRTANDTRRQNT